MMKREIWVPLLIYVVLAALLSFSSMVPIKSCFERSTILIASSMLWLIGAKMLAWKARLLWAYFHVFLGYLLVQAIMRPGAISFMMAHHHSLIILVIPLLMPNFVASIVSLICQFFFQRRSLPPNNHS